MNKKELYIPVNVPDRNELIPGFGAKELVCCGIALVIAIVTALIMYLAGINMLWNVGVAIGIIATAVLIWRKDKYGENLIFKTQYVIAFHKSQQKFVYSYHNIYEGSDKKK